MSSRAKSLFEFPRGMAQLLVGANIIVFALCVSQSSTAEISLNVLLRYGALYSQALERHEYWRLISYGFLHANPIHLLANMLCLVLWGGLLERRVEALYFTVIYLCGLVFGGIASSVTHPGPYLAVGASGAISAVLGALLCLRVLGKIGLPWNFFVVNIGLNVMIAIGASRVDWQAHLGGFVAGMVSCACLDLLEKTIVRMLRCKFPEFMKMNTFVAFAIVLPWSWSRFALQNTLQNTWAVIVVSLVAVVVTIKLLDLILSMKKGLAAVVMIFALVNAMLVFMLADMFSQAATSFCVTGAAHGAAAIVAKACMNLDLVVYLTAIGAFGLTFLFYWPHLARGIADVGFVGAALRGERERRWGV
jgi:membrane associated rhomboid family serine protease